MNTNVGGAEKNLKQNWLPDFREKRQKHIEVRMDAF